MTQKTITESDFNKLNEELAKAKDIAQRKAKLDAEEKENRAKLLELGATLVDEESRVAAPGVTVKLLRDIKYDEKAALAWALDGMNFASSGGLLQIRKDSVATLIGYFLRMEVEHPDLAKQINFRAVFEIYKAGYEGAIAEGRFVGLPFQKNEKKLSLDLRPELTKVGTELRELFVIVPDDEAVTENVAETVGV